MRHACLVLLLAATAAATACRKEAAPAPPAPPKAEAPAASAPPKPAAYSPRVEVIVDETGFVPEKIPAKAGQKITLAITRKTEKTCATEILFAGQEGKTELPLNKTVEVVYTPKATGPIKFGCGMGMMIGGQLDVTD